MVFRFLGPLCLLSAAIAAGPYSTGLGFEPARASFQPTDCWVEVADSAATDCGWLTVPERWDRPDERTLRLPVVIYRPREPDPALAPVIYLSGGPGYPALGPDGEDIAGWRYNANHQFPGRTLIIFDQRGLGLGSPRLDCPEVSDPHLWWRISPDPSDFGEEWASLLAATSACRARLTAAGHDLSAFTSRQSAADVEALRHALGLGPVVLFGISYGTRLALTVMRHYEDSVEAAILDSVFPPQSMSTGEDGEAYGGTLDRLFAACLAYARCAKAFPNLRARLLQSLAALATEPAILEIINPKGGAPLYARIDHRAYLEILRQELYHTRRLPDLPALIDAVAQGRYERLKTHAENAIYGPFPEDYDLGMYLSVACSDQAGVTLRQSDVDGSGPHPYLGDFIAWARDGWGRESELCRTWQVGAPDPIESTAVTSDVPSLLLAGALDGSTPVEWAEMAAETLSGSHLFVFPAIAHVQTYNSRCARQIVLAFLADPLIRPHPPCLDTLRKPAFRTLG